jgi:AraC family transcriptional regulator of adaptative response/methylated-DNA-[protein]-cysteine methyltransferase
MLTSTCNRHHTESQAVDVLIPLIRAAATISFAVVPCSLGFVIIAVSEQLIRSIMVGDDPEMLVSDLQNQFPNDAIELADDEEGLAAQVVDLIDRPAPGAELPLDIRGLEIHTRVRDALKDRGVIGPLSE